MALITGESVPRAMEDFEVEVVAYGTVDDLNPYLF
jgi:hypothetical protein